jgi:hypothetical protein
MVGNEYQLKEHFIKPMNVPSTILIIVQLEDAERCSHRFGPYAPFVIALKTVLLGCKTKSVLGIL